MIYIIDIDNTICVTPNVNGVNRYDMCIPMYDHIKKINELVDLGHIVNYWTARGTSTGKDWLEFTINQLDGWGCKYNSIQVGKPSYDVWIDDKAINSDTYFKNIEDK